MGTAESVVRHGQQVKAPAPRYGTSAGTHFPPGASADADGVNFSICSRDATAAELRLYEGADSDEPFQVIPLAPGIFAERTARGAVTKARLPLIRICTGLAQD
jgi:pullulanase/glycogen debranching enzyme